MYSLRTPLSYQNAAVILACLFFTGASLYFAWTTFCAIVNFAWHTPMFDQWQSYETFLTLPFPQNVVQLENGHRPIFPNLIRVAEIRWFAADQGLQIAFGTIFALFTSLAIAIVVWREGCAPVVARCVGVMLAMLGVLWLANARMLLHGNESLHVYLVTLCTTCASLLTYQARARHSVKWLGVASILCFVATFSFGPGVATFAAVLLLAVILRLPKQWLLLPLSVLAIALLLYLFALPGDQGVRGTLHLHPLDNLHVGVQWLSAPWVNGWLGLADPPLGWVNVDPNSRMGRFLTNAANDVVVGTGIPWLALSTLIGSIGVAGFALRVAFLAGQSAALTRWQVVAVGLGTFAIASSATLAIGRFDYFEQHPDQIYAPRYLVWPSLFWCACALLITFDAAHWRSKALRSIALIVAITLPIVLSTTQKAGIGWAEAVYRLAEKSVASARSGVFDPDVFPDGPDASRATVLRTLALLREQHLAMFAKTDWERIGTLWIGTLEHEDGFLVDAHVGSAFMDDDLHTPVAHIEGHVERGIEQITRDGGQLVVFDEDKRIVGFAEFSEIAAPTPQFSIPLKRGFEGYIRDYRAGEHYQLVALWSSHNRAYSLSTFTGT